MSNFPHNYSSPTKQGVPDVVIPSSLMSQRVPKAIPTRNQVLSLASQSGSANASGTINFQIPGGQNSNGFLRAGSLFWRGKVVVTLAAVGGNADNITQFSSETLSAASLINRFQLNANGVNLETISRYDNYHAILQSQAMNPNYVDKDSSIAEYCNSGVTSGTAQTATFNFCIPLCSGVLSNEKSFPLFLSGLYLQFDLNSAIGAFKTRGTSSEDPASYVVSENELVYEIIQPDFSLLQGMREQMSSSGRLFELPCSTALGLQSNIGAGVTSFSYNVGLNLASVSAVLMAEIQTSKEVLGKGASSAVVRNSFIRNSTESNTVSRKYFLDSKQLCSYNISMDSQNLLECQRALSALLDPQITTLGARAVVTNEQDSYTASGVATQRFYVSGQSARRFNEADAIAMCGTPANTLVIQNTKDGTPIASSVYIYVIYDQVIVISADGSVAVAK